MSVVSYALGTHRLVGLAYGPLAHYSKYTSWLRP